MAVILAVLLPPVLFTTCFVALLALYTWRIFVGTSNWSKDAESELASSTYMDTGKSVTG